jgi:V/A-type H+-transporting ATPase subunit B
MDRGIGKDRTREDHAGVSNQLYAAYAEGCDLRDLVAIVGEDALSDRDKKFLEFADKFEKKFVSQEDHEDRSIEKTLEIGWDLFSILPKSELKKIDEKYISKYLKKLNSE